MGTMPQPSASAYNAAGGALSYPTEDSASLY